MRLVIAEEPVCGPGTVKDQGRRDRRWSQLRNGYWHDAIRFRAAALSGFQRQGSPRGWPLRRGVSEIRLLGGVGFDLNLLEVRQRPGPIEVGFGRLVESEIREPVLAGNGGDPILLEACRRLRRAKDVH